MSNSSYLSKFPDKFSQYGENFGNKNNNRPCSEVLVLNLLVLIFELISSYGRLFISEIISMDYVDIDH